MLHSDVVYVTELSFVAVKQPSGGGGGPAVLTESPEFCEVPNSEPSAAVWEPMLCNEVEDGQAPLSLELLYHTAQVTSPDDAVMVAGHLLMLETGFVPQVRQRGSGKRVKAGTLSQCCVSTGRRAEAR